MIIRPRLCGASRPLTNRPTYTYPPALHLPGGLTMIRYRFVIAIAAMAAACLLIAADGHARAGGGFSGGSRGTRTFSAPPVTQTAPNSAAPMQRTLAQPGNSNTAGRAATP